MAVYRSDRDRRIGGDRILARVAEFKAIHSGVAEAVDRFVEVHKHVAHLIAERMREEGEDTLARAARDHLSNVGVQLYAWAFSNLDALLQPSWDQPFEAELSTQLKEQLFPLGIPSAVGAGAQLTLDALTHLESALKRNPDIGFKESFVKEVSKARFALSESIGKTVTETAETKAAAERVAAARSQWDQTHLALQEITTGFLRLEGRPDEARKLFYRIGRKNAGVAEADTEVALGDSDGATQPSVVETEVTE